MDMMGFNICRGAGGRGRGVAVLLPLRWTEFCMCVLFFYTSFLN